jgi:DNA-binding response OmpR family regulator
MRMFTDGGNVTVSQGPAARARGLSTLARVKVLVVEDDKKLSRFLLRVLSEEGLAADTCASGADALMQAKTGLYDLILLDWMLPDLDGLELCRRLRGLGLRSSILMLTARGEVSERVLGLNAGADDYLTKPFELDELIARIHALLRRSSGLPKLLVGELEIDRDTHVVRLAGVAIDLTPRELSVLLHLAHRTGQVVPRSELLARVWASTFERGTNVVEVQMCRLREKFGAHAWMIETVRGRGYRLVTEPAE